MSHISNRMKAMVALVVLATVVAVGLLVVLVVGPRVIPPVPPAGTPTATLVPGARELGDQFLISNVGEEYFRAHYRFEKAQPTEWPGTVRLYYRYNYPPHVADYQMFFCFDVPFSRICEMGYTNDILLEPQEFRVSHEQAIAVAQAHGIQASAADMYAKVVLSFRDEREKGKKRFYWSVSRRQDWDTPDRSFNVVIIDVETGEAFIEKVEMDVIRPPQRPGIDWPLLVGAGVSILAGIALAIGVIWKLRRRKR